MQCIGVVIRGDSECGRCRVTIDEGVDLRIYVLAISSIKLMKDAMMHEQARHQNEV